MFSCYNSHSLNTPKESSTKPAPLKCHGCGSDLILVKVVVHTVDNNPYPITKTTYRCSDDVCQAESEKRAAKKLELKLEQDLARENRRKALHPTPAIPEEESISESAAK